MILIFLKQNPSFWKAKKYPLRGGGRIYKSSINKKPSWFGLDFQNKNIKYLVCSIALL